VDLLPTAEQDEIIATVRSQLEREFDLHALAESDGAAQVVDDALWQRCAELGWFGLGMAEALGGVGYTLVEEALLFAEVGAHATPGPFLPTVLVAAELAGIATATADQSTQYAKDREQFGQPVGGFQAVKHRCADMAVRAEAATSLVRYASLAVRDGHHDARFHAEAARAVAAAAAVDNAQINVQNHGGIGFTWEHTAHRYVTRAQVRSRTVGTLRDALADLLSQPSPA